MLPLTTCTRLLPKVKACIRDASCFHGNRCQVFTEICYLCTKRLTLMRLRQPQVKKYPFSYLFLATIWILCFCYPPRTPLDNVAFIDKWVHIVMYAGTCTTIWIEYLRHHKTPETMKLLYGHGSPCDDERTDRDTAGKLHRRQEKRRLARLCGQCHRRNAGCRYRNSSGKESRQALNGERRSDEL